MSNYLEVLKV